MNEMKTLDDAVIELGGVWHDKDCNLMHWFVPKSVYGCNNYGDSSFCTKEQFQQRAKELGFVGKYRWGVEYKTDGKQPELADDVVIRLRQKPESGFLPETDAVGCEWPNVYSFKITDQRYKPADTSYLDKAGSSLDNDADWYDYDNKKALRLPPVGTKLEFNYQTDKQWETSFVVAVHHYRKDLIIATFDSSGSLMYANEPHRFRPLDHDRRAKAERKRVVDAAQKECVNFSSNDLGRLYDKGFLRLPD